MLTPRSSAEIIDLATAREIPPADSEQVGRNGFVKWDRATAATPAWLAMSGGAIRLYMQLKSYWSERSDNNGDLYLSTRKAANALRSSRVTIRRRFRELVHYGFVVVMDPGTNKLAPRLRLTELPYNGEPPTQDYLRWNGVLFDRGSEVDPQDQRVRSRPSRGSEVDPPEGQKLTQNKRDIIRNKNKNTLSEPDGSDVRQSLKKEKVGRPKGGPPSYSEDFESFWHSYLDKTNNSKKAAYVEWRRLPAEDRAAAAASLPAYAA